MYYYVYDEYVQDQKFERELALIETRLTDLGISGKIARLALFRDPKEMIRDEVKKGAMTVVAVGNDMTLRKVIDAIGDSGVAIGIIPLGASDNNIADILGVPVGVLACDTLSARIIEELDVGVVNGERFLNSMTISDGFSSVIDCNGQYKMMPGKKCSVEIRNLALADDTVRAANPTDGMLEIVIRCQKSGWFSRGANRVSVVPVENAYITSEKPMVVSVDGEEFEGKELKIEVIKNRLRVVTGKGRKF